MPRSAINRREGSYGDGHRPDMQTDKITDKAIRALPTPLTGKQIILREKYLVGFAVRKTATGCISFIFNYTACGRERRITIGRQPAWTVVAARAEATKLRRIVDLGEDPLADREAKRKELTIEQFFEVYRSEVLFKKAQKTRSEEAQLWRRFLLPYLGSRSLREVAPADIDRLHNQVSIETPIQANRMIAAIRKAFSVAIRWGLIEANPASGVTLNPEVPRERYLSPVEQAAFVRALSSKPDTPSILAIWFLMLTGARSGEVFTAEWSQFDLPKGIWTKPSSHTKQRRSHRVPLSMPAISVLRRAEKLRSNNYVFCHRDGRPIRGVRKTFRSICQEAGVTDFRPHDLRHHYASVLAMEGVSLHVIGKLLGHSQPSTTNRYAHLADEPLRMATELAGRKM